MSEKVIVRQNNRFEIEFWAQDPEAGEAAQPEPVSRLHELTPYGMMLASLGSCTTIVLHTYAQNHAVGLEAATLELAYKRFFKEDCENCEGIDRYDERIQVRVKFLGDLSEIERGKLSHIAEQCSIHKMFEQGVKIETQVVETEELAPAS